MLKQEPKEMKTFSQHLKEQSERDAVEYRTKQDLVAFRTEWIKKLSELKIPVDAGATEEYRQQVQASICTSIAVQSEFACDTCKTALFYPDPHMILASNPPCKRIVCPGCGWVGYDRA